MNNNSKYWDKYNFSKEILNLIEETEYIYNITCISEMELHGEEPFYLSDWIKEYIKNMPNSSTPEKELFFIALGAIRELLFNSVA